MDINLPPLLLNKLWHTTSSKRCQQILESGAILANPPIDDNDRYGTSKNYPLVRMLGGISLFDFTDFDPKAYKKECPISTWWTFVPYNKRWEESTWIEINREMVKDKLIDGKELSKISKEKKLHKHLFMPNIETAYIGDIKIDCFLNIFRFNNTSQQFVPFKR